jgi:hypothetical protein
VIPRYHEMLIVGEARGTILMVRGKGHAFGWFADLLLPRNKVDRYTFELKEGTLRLSYGVTARRPDLPGPYLRRRGLKPAMDFKEQFVSERGEIIGKPCSRRVGYFAEYDVPHSFTGEMTVSFRRDAAAMVAEPGDRRAALNAFYADKRVLQFENGVLVQNEPLPDQDPSIVPED